MEIKSGRLAIFLSKYFVAKMRVRLLWLIPVVLLLMNDFVACGQTGPLYLPEKPHPTQQKQQQKQQQKSKEQPPEERQAG